MAAGVLVDFFRVCRAAERRVPGAKAVSRTTVHLGQFLGCSIQLLNYFWMGKMIKGAFKVFGRQPDGVNDLQQDVAM